MLGKDSPFTILKILRHTKSISGKRRFECDIEQNHRRFRAELDVEDFWDHIRLFRAYLTENFSHNEELQLFKIVAGSKEEEPNKGIVWNSNPFEKMEPINNLIRIQIGDNEKIREEEVKDQISEEKNITQINTIP